MNKQPIANARDADLRLSQDAMKRAAQRARELAGQTGTAIVISHQGKLELLTVANTAASISLHEPLVPYENKGI